MTTLSNDIDWQAVETKARGMRAASLVYVIEDCRKAAQAADDLERAGCYPLLKSSGYYRDEASVYHAELKRRQRHDPAK